MIGLLIVVMLSIGAVAEEQGFLNVITGRPAAKIFIDGELVGSDFIRKYALMEGEHYVRIEYNGQLMYAKMVMIEPNKLRTITSENFVDIRTKTANRGAINRESQRLQDSKGDFGLGFQWGGYFPAKGMSIKWFSPIAIGVQVSAIGKTKMDGKDVSEFGARAIIPIGNKIFSGTNLTGFSTLGVVQRTEDSIDSTYAAGSIGIEFGFADPVYFTAEVGIANGLSDTTEDGLLFSWGAGVHFYF